MRLERITVQAFRGYPHRVDVVLSGDVVLLYGENGAGKTSLTEGFEWALFGTIVRKARSKTPGEYQGWSWIRSAHAPDDVPTFAEVELVDSDGGRHIVRRELVGREPALTINGKSATDIRSLKLQTEDAFRPFLGQCEIQALIDSEQQDRWEQLSAILGFADFGRARARLQRLRTDTNHDPRVSRVRETATRAVQPLTPPGEDPLAVDPDDLRKRTVGYLGLDEASTWSRILEAAQEQLEELYSRDRRPPGLDRLLIGRDELASAASDLERSVERVLTEVEEHRRWHLAHIRSEFAEHGLALLDETHPSLCPFCGEATLTDQRVSELRETASAVAERPRDSRSELQSALGNLQIPGPLNLDVVPAMLEAVTESEERVTLQKAADEQHELDGLRERLAGLGAGFLAATDNARRPSGDPVALMSLAAQLEQVTQELADRFAAVRAAVETINLGLTKRFTSLGEDDRKRLAGLQTAKLIAENAGAVRAAWRIRTLQAEVAELIEALETAEKDQMTKALALLSADIRRYYEELSPGHHIQITGITVRDSKRRQAALGATSFGKPVNPVTMFSEAEGNCLGLSLYFSQRVDRNPRWKMILLDDPVQSMDEGHEQGLVNLLARVSRDHQVIVMTHDRRFAEFVEAQFGAVASFTRYNVVRGSDPQPRIEIAAGRLDELLDYAERNAGGDVALRESCAAAVRKAVERFCRDIAANHGIQLKRRLGPEEMVDRVHAAGLIDDIEVGTLHRLRRFGSRGAHDDVSANAAEPAIRSNVNALRELQLKYLSSARRPELRVVSGGKSDAASADHPA